MTLALTTLALTFCSCGGTPSRLARSELLRRADAICKGVAERRDRTYTKGSEKFASALPPLVVFERAAFDRLEALRPPLPMVEEWRQMIALDRMAVAGRAKAARDARAGHLELAEADMAKVTHVEEQAAQIGLSDGFLYCSLVET